MRGSNAALSAAWNVTGYPTLLAVCNGNPALAERYSGELKSERIASFLVRFEHASCVTTGVDLATVRFSRSDEKFYSLCLRCGLAVSRTAHCA